MNILRIPKAGSSSTNSRQSPASDNGNAGESISGGGGSSGVPMAIRFHANEESVEEIMAPVPQNDTATGSNFLSSSPQFAQLDDFSWRKDILQSNFLHRKRSESTEDSNFTENLLPTANASNSTAVNSGGDTMGTWKMIKGKVSQAMEDIKSKNIPSPMTPVQTSKSVISINNGDSDNELPTHNSSLSEDRSLDLDLSNTVAVSGSVQSKFPLKIQAQQQHGGSDSDSEIDANILDSESIPIVLPVHQMSPATSSTTSLRRPFASLRSKALATASSKAIAKMSASGGITTTARTTTTTTTDSDSSIRSGFLRKRRKDRDTSSSGPISTVKSKKPVEIESGVEMLEDMVLPTVSGLESDTISASKVSFNRTDQTTTDGLHLNSNSLPDSMKSNSSEIPDRPQNSTYDILASTVTGDNLYPTDSNMHFVQLLINCLMDTVKSRSFIVTLVLLAILVFFQMREYFIGVFSCLFAISFFNTITDLLKLLAKHSHRIFCIANKGPERIPFKIPDYSKLPICEIPAAEEYKSLKTYAGWMTEINNYDPSHFHISMTRPIYVRLDGGVLRISNTSSRIPKRAMWNEAPIHRKNVTFTQNRYFNLLGCRVEMCPRGLARKRYFSRKYPIHLIIKTSTDSMKIDNTLTDNSTTTTNHQNVPKSSSDLTTSDIHSRETISLQSQDSPISHQNSNDSIEDKIEDQGDFDFSAAILHSDLQKLQEPEIVTTNKESVPCGDETRLLLFARCDREKEDWYRRFVAASVGQINDQELQIPDIIMMTDEEIAAAIKAVPNETAEETVNIGPVSTLGSINEDPSNGDGKRDTRDENIGSSSSPFEGLLMTTDAARNPYDYIKFMSCYQKACKAEQIPVIKNSDSVKKNRRQKKQEDELWKGINQNLYLGPSGSVVWANVLIGRVMFSCLNDQMLLERIQEFLQKKLSAIKLPSFMEDVIIAQTYLGDTPPLIHRVSQAMLDERGIWIDADVTYEGLMHMTVTTKLNLLRLKRQQQQQQQQQQTFHESTQAAVAPIITTTGLSDSLQSDMTRNRSGSIDIPITGGSAKTINLDAHAAAIYDSNAESSGASSSDSESITTSTVDSNEPPAGTSPQQTFYNTPGSSRRLLRIVDRITASNLFQSATEISYIQRAMENMSTKITLRVELKGLVARVAINLPPPPSDRIWIGFRGPPRLWISAKPAVGDHTFDWSIVTNVIESKLCEEVYKYLVYPNMVDIIAPFLGQSTYKE